MPSRNLGMGPVKLLLERSNCSSTPRVFNPFGICSCSRFPCKYRNRSWTQPSIASGISPSSLFIERSIVPRLFKCPICIGIAPLRAFLERLRSMVREGILNISSGIWPVNRLQERSMDSIFDNFPRLGGMLLFRKLLDRER